MTPIEKLRKWADCAWDAPDELRLLLAAYDARGEELDYRRAFGSGEPWKDRDVRAIAELRVATDSAVAKAEGGKA